MFARLSLMFIVVAGLCSGAFMLGGTAAAGQGSAVGIPQEHPISVALRFRQELGLTTEQASRLEELRAEFAKEFGPIRERAESIERRMRDLQQSEKPDEAKGQALRRDMETLGSTVQPLFERYAQEVAQLLSPEQREKLMRLSAAHTEAGDSREFVLMFLLQTREPLSITPQQFTKLQYLQADFIRAFAPLREQMELTQMEVQEKFGKAGKEPPADFQARMEAVQQKVKELQSQFSERAVNDVLQPNQREKLQELLRGDRRATHKGG